MGLEPTNGGTTIHCLNHLATLAIMFFIITFLAEIDPALIERLKILGEEEWAPMSRL